MADKSRERALESALFALYEEWAKLPIAPGYQRRYYATRFLQTIKPHYKRYKGGIDAVKDVLHKPETIGLDRLKNHPRLTVEALVLNGKWDDLFSDQDRRVAKQKLATRSK